MKMAIVGLLWLILVAMLAALFIVLILARRRRAQPRGFDVIDPTDLSQRK